MSIVQGLKSLHCVLSHWAVHTPDSQTSFVQEILSLLQAVPFATGVYTQPVLTSQLSTVHGVLSSQELLLTKWIVLPVLRSHTSRVHTISACPTMTVVWSQPSAAPQIS